MSKLDRFKIARARQLRSTMTDEERILWSELWRIPLEGTHFRRQEPLGKYYVDFVSHRLRLIIELDGWQHAEEAAQTYDAVRTGWLESQGYRVIRFWNNEVKRELSAVLDTIFAAVEEQRRLHPTPARAAPTLPIEGEGEEPSHA